MNPGALPPALSELFLPERAANGDRIDPTGKATSSGSGDADRFERYLSSARQSIRGEQALPAGAAPDRTLVARSETDRSVAERSDRPERPAPVGDDKRRANDSAVDGPDRRRDVKDRNRVDADDRRVDDTSRAGRTDERSSAPSSEADASDGTVDPTVDATAEADAKATAEAESPAETVSDDETVEAEVAIDTTGLVSGAADLDLAAELDGASANTVHASSESTIDLNTATDGGVVEGASSLDQTGEVEEEGEADPTTLGAQAERGADPVVAAAVAATVTTDADRASTTSAEESVVATDDATIDEPGSASDATAISDGASTDLGDLDLTDGGDTPVADDAGSAVDGQGTVADDAGSVGDATTTDTPDAAPVVAPAAAGATGSNAANTGSPIAIDALAGPTGPRNRPTNSTTTTQGAQEAQVPLADGEAGDPLWLQVRRAMGSLRTLQSGEQQMTIRLRPAELGSVMVRVNSGEQGTTVSLMADSAVAANQLSQQRQQLISELEQGGLAGVAVDVGTGGNTDLRDEATGQDPDSDGAGAGGSAAAAVAGAGLAAARSGGRGRRAGGSSGSLVDVDL